MENPQRQSKHQPGVLGHISRGSGRVLWHMILHGTGGNKRLSNWTRLWTLGRWRVCSQVVGGGQLGLCSRSSLKGLFSGHCRIAAALRLSGVLHETCDMTNMEQQGRMP